MSTCILYMDVVLYSGIADIVRQDTHTHMHVSQYAVSQYAGIHMHGIHMHARASHASASQMISRGVR